MGWGGELVKRFFQNISLETLQILSDISTSKKGSHSQIWTHDRVKVSLLLAEKADTLALPHLGLRSQDFENRESPSSKWCLPRRSPAKSLDISKGHLALERQLDQRSGSSGFPAHGSVAASRVLDPPRALALGGWQLLGGKDMFLRLMATAGTNTSFPQPQRSGGGPPPSRTSRLQTVPGIRWFQLWRVYSVC